MARLSLQNPLVTMGQIRNPPSKKDGISAVLETDLRNCACELIQSCGILLSLPQRSMATAQVLLQRFYYIASLKQHPIRDVALGAVFLACKVEETPRSIQDITNTMDYTIHHRRGQKYKFMIPYGREFYDMKEGLIRSEMELLRHSGFNVHVQLPYALMLNYLKILCLYSNLELAQKAWSYLNDGLRTPIYVSYDPPTLACAVIFLAAREFNIILPNSPPWYELFEARLDEMETVCAHILRLYTRRLDPFLPLTSSELTYFLEDEAAFRNQFDE